MAEDNNNQEAARYLKSLGWSDEDARKWLAGPARKDPAAAAEPSDPYAQPPRAQTAGRAYEQPGDTGTGFVPPPVPTRPQYGPGVLFRDIEYWCSALRQSDLPSELRTLYVRRLKAALEAAETPGVTPEDIAYWLHALDDPTLPAELRALYRNNARDALRKYKLEEA